MPGTPFIIFALPRSRTYWLSRFLSYGDFECKHEPGRHFRGLDDLRSATEMDFVGWASTSAALYWEVIGHYRPEMKAVVVRRPVDDVIASLSAIDLSGICKLDMEAVSRMVHYLDRRLDQIAGLPGVMSVDFDDLRREDVCAKIFENCLPYPHDHCWWESLRDRNLQCNFRTMVRESQSNARQIARFQTLIRGEMRRLVETGKIGLSPRRDDEDKSVKIGNETIDSILADGQDLIAQHVAEIGPRPGVELDLNFEMARVHERMGIRHTFGARKGNALVGYMSFTISESTENKAERFATQGTSFVLPSCRGIGPKMLNHAVEFFRAKGIDEMFLRAGSRGSGDKYPILFKRMGAREEIRVFSLRLKEK